MKKNKIAKINWVPEEVDIDLIDPTPNNYKIKTDLGQAMLQASLEHFGLAGTVVVLAYKVKDAKKYKVKPLSKKTNKGERYLLIDGNSRFELAKEEGRKRIYVSVPDVYLSPKTFVEMTAQYDRAKAGEVDTDRIDSELGTTKEFFEKFNMEVPMHLIDRIGKRHDDLEYGGKSKSKDAKEAAPSDVKMLNIILSSKQEDLFRKWEPTLHDMFETDNISDMIFQALKYCYKQNK